METDPSYLLAQAIGSGILWIVYSIIVLFMVKVQKMKVGFLGVLVSCFLGVAATFVPYVGIYLSFPVTVFCLWRFAGTHAFGDATFTVVISGALMFCFKLFLLGTIMGSLSNTFDGFLPPPEIEVEAQEAEVLDPVPVEEPESGFDWSLIQKEEFTLKGITAGTSRPIVMFLYGEQMYTLEEGESCGVRTESSVVRVTCQKVDRTQVDFLLDDEEVLTLSLD